VSEPAKEGATHTTGTTRGVDQSANGGGGGGAGEPKGGSGAMFDAIAGNYDLVNRIISLGVDQSWRRRAVRAMNLEGEARALDLATGTGDLAIMIARMAPRARVVGLDPSPKMLAVGTKKVQGEDLAERVTLEVGDAQAIDAPDASFDATSIAFGIRNVPDRPRALREMARVVRPGGRVVILELAEPTTPILGALARWHIHSVVPAIGAFLSGAREYRYLEKSIAAFPPREEFAAMMQGCGLDVLEAAPLTFGVASLYVATPRAEGHDARG
jgi:demethylmenaquinone methyltransferase / 2-methoxy-6-polyprenyl-1,4-benzoquinol methylase